MNVEFWVTLARAALIMALGVALLVYPDKAFPLLLNSMGLFWFFAGLVSLRWALSDKRERGLPLIAGIVGMLLGVVVLTRAVTLTYGPDSLMIVVVATLMLVTGVLHAFRGFRTGEQYSRHWSIQSLILGAIEIGLAVLLYVTPFERGQMMYILLAVWALVGGVFLISQAFYTRQQTMKQDRSVETLQAGDL